MNLIKCPCLTIINKKDYMKCKLCKQSGGGGAVCTIGRCIECEKQVSDCCGSCPMFCKDCSEKLNRCEKCGVIIK